MQVESRMGGEPGAQAIFRNSCRVFCSTASTKSS